MLGVSGIVVQLIGDTLRWWRLTFRSTQSLKAENLFLRPQLALYVEHGMKPRRIDPVTRISLAILSRFFNCGSVRSKSVLRGLHHEYSLSWAQYLRTTAGSGCSRSAARVSRLPRPVRAIATGNHMQSVPIRFLGGLHHEYSLAPCCA